MKQTNKLGRIFLVLSLVSLIKSKEEGRMFQVAKQKKSPLKLGELFYPPRDTFIFDKIRATRKF